MSSFIGSPEKVVNALMAPESRGVERVQLTPYTPDTFEILAPHMPH